MSRSELERMLDNRFIFHRDRRTSLRTDTAALVTFDRDATLERVLVKK